MHVTPTTAARFSPLLPALGQASSDVGLIAAEATPRGYIVGPAGSGKTYLLRHLRELLAGRGVAVRTLDEGVDPRAVPAAEVLVVDGLHLLDERRAAAVRARSEDAGASLVIATRPWPRSHTTSAIARRLSVDSPSIVLGPVTRAEVSTLLDARGRILSLACIDDVLACSGGLGWLVARAIEAHDDKLCTGVEDHVGLWSAVKAHVAHRLDVLDDERLQHFLELLSLVRDGHPEALPGTDVSDLLAQGYAEGLLLRNGTMVPVVRTALRDSLPPQRFSELAADAVDEIAAAVAAGDENYRTWATAMADPRLGSALAARADDLLPTDPQRAGELYQLASDCGPQPSDLTLRQASAAWGTGDLDGAAAFADAAMAGVDPTQWSAVADVAAAVWAARGMLTTGSDVYSFLPPLDGASAVRATLTHVGAGSVDRLTAVRPAQIAAPVHPEVGALSTLRIALRELDSGLRSSLDSDPSSKTLTHLIRASDLYTSSHATDPISELPAVVTASVALGSGDLSTAQRAIDTAVAGVQGGAWAQRRLLLWQAWVALQGERPADARHALLRAERLAFPYSPRDEFLRQSVLVSLARRYEDLSSLESAWAAASQSVRHVDVDLYTVLPLSSLICAAARVGDDRTLHPHFVTALEILDRLGAPPLWSTHLRWAGIQQGIVLNRPEMLAPHARALVAAAPRNRLAEAMAHAGGIWVAVLGGSVDVDAVDAAARSLASKGLAWDGARLAAHGARRTDDRKVSSRLLSCARELHPQDVSPRPDQNITNSPDSSTPASSNGTPLSEREAEVARHVLEGRTYAEIGEVMFISPRTVEHHVAHIRRRLAATSRSDLMAKLRVSVELTAISTHTPARRLIS